MDGNTSSEPKPGRERDESGEKEGVSGKLVPPDQRAGAEGEPDAYLDVPSLKVDQLCLDVDDLRAYVALIAEVVGLVKVNAGADARMGKTKLEIRGVEAQAQLRIRLDNVAFVIDRTLTTLDRNPEIVRHLGEAAGELGEATKGITQAAGKGTDETSENLSGVSTNPPRDQGEAACEDTGHREEKGTPEEKGAEEKGAPEEEKKGAEEKGEEETGRPPESAEKQDEGEEAAGQERPETSPMQDALNQTEESVRDLGRALLRMFPPARHLV